MKVLSVEKPRLAAVVHAIDMTTGRRRMPAGMEGVVPHMGKPFMTITDFLFTNKINVSQVSRALCFFIHDCYEQECQLAWRGQRST